MRLRLDYIVVWFFWIKSLLTRTNSNLNLLAMPVKDSNPGRIGAGRLAHSPLRHLFFPLPSC